MRISLTISIMLSALIGFSSCQRRPKDSLDVSGQWMVSLDSCQQNPCTIQLPGTTDQAGIGTANTLTPGLTKPQILHLTRKHSFMGEAVYTKEIQIPAQMAGKPLRLVLERVLWKSTLYVDGKEMGTPELSLVTPPLSPDF